MSFAHYTLYEKMDFLQMYALVASRTHYKISCLQK